MHLPIKWHPYHLLNIYIDGNKVNPDHILDFKISHTLFSNDEFELGSVTAKSIEIKIYKNSLPNTLANKYVNSAEAFFSMLRFVDRLTQQIVYQASTWKHW